jgi:hypothetical protein
MEPIVISTALQATGISIPLHGLGQRCGRSRRTTNRYSVPLLLDTASVFKDHASIIQLRDYCQLRHAIYHMDGALVLLKPPRGINNNNNDDMLTTMTTIPPNPKSLCELVAAFDSKRLCSTKGLGHVGGLLQVNEFCSAKLVAPVWQGISHP